MNQGTEAQSSIRGPALKEPALVLRAGAATHCSPMAHSPETRPPLSGEQNGTPSPIYRRYIFGFSMGAFSPPRECAISQARALSTRCLYALKWSVFFAWSTTCDADPVICDISLIFSFLQELLEKGRPLHAQGLCSSYSSLTYSYRWPISGQEQLSCFFLEGV